MFRKKKVCEGYQRRIETLEKFMEYYRGICKFRISRNYEVYHFLPHENGNSEKILLDFCFSNGYCGSIGWWEDDFLKKFEKRMYVDDCMKSLALGAGMKICSGRTHAIVISKKDKRGKC